jgi:hypothetical protein
MTHQCVRTMLVAVALSIVLVPTAHGASAVTVSSTSASPFAGCAADFPTSNRVNSYRTARSNRS